VLKAITIELPAREFIAIVGPNGAGKSTLLKILAGLIRGYQGAVKFFGQPASAMAQRELAKRIAFVPQEAHIAFPFTVAEIASMGRLPYRPHSLFDSPVDMRAVHEALVLTDTAALSSKYFNQLSGGERQRVVLASALAQNPEVLLLDEPTVYLDLKHQAQFYRILDTLNRDRGLSIVCVTHDVNLVAPYAHRMIAISSGKIVADGRPEDVLTPQHLYEIFEVTASVVRRPDGRGSYIIPED
jgi:iron complex transport system ATP-binding protein